MRATGVNCATPLPSDSPCLVWRGRVLSCHTKSNTLRQQQQQLADILVQVPPNNCAAFAVVWRVVAAVPLGYVFFLCSFFHFLATAQLLSLLLDVRFLCLLFRGCPVVLDIELSVSAGHQKTRVLLCARRLVLLLIAAAASGGECVLSSH